MKYLVIPDVHCRNFWRKAIDDNLSKVDKVIFLGDYLDPYPEEYEKNISSMEIKDFHDSENALIMLYNILQLKKNEPDKYILLTGNHTDSYIWSEFQAASRTDRRNYEKYHKFFLENLKYFNLVWIQDDVIFSHAGISKGWAENFLYSYMEYDEGAMLEKDSVVFEAARVLKDTALEDFNRHYIDAISDISYYRGGYSSYGSCEWADLREHLDIQHSSETTIIPKGEEGMYQVFGHTQLKAPLINDKWACLDCRKAFIIDTNTFEITE